MKVNLLKSLLNLFLEKTTRTKIVSLLIICIAVGYEYFFWETQFNNYTNISQSLSEFNSKSIDLIVQLNTFLLTLSGALFAVLGITHNSKKKSELTIYTIVFGVTAVSIAFFYGYKSMYEVLNQMSQNQIALKPKNSVAVMYLSKEFYRFLCAICSIGLGYIFNIWSYHE